jgi:hypothetical protein
MEQMMERLLAKFESKMDAHIIADKEHIQEMVARMEINQAKVDANLKELKQDIKTNQVKTDENLKEMREEILSRAEAIGSETYDVTYLHASGMLFSSPFLSAPPPSLSWLSQFCYARQS